MRSQVRGNFRLRIKFEFQCHKCALSGWRFSRRAPMKVGSQRRSLRWRCGFDQREFVLIRATVGQNFSATEKFEHCVLADCTRLPRGDDLAQLITIDASRAEIRV